MTKIKFALPDGRTHTFLKGHQVMVQIQSSWFPLADRKRFSKGNYQNFHTEGVK